MPKHTIPTLEFALDDHSEQTSSAFLLGALQWAHQHRFWQPFHRLLTIDMKTVHYSPIHKLQTLVASILVGCQYNVEVNQRLVPDGMAAALLGLERFPDQSQLNLLLRRLDASNLQQLAAVHAAHLTQYAKSTATAPGYHFVDIDQCGLVVTGKSYELCRKGYFPRRRGAQGYQMGAAWLGDHHLTLALTLDPGNTHCSSRLPTLVQDSLARCQEMGLDPQRVVYRLDAGYGGQPQIKWLLAGGYRFVAKAAVRRADKWAARVTPGAWRRINERVQVAEVPNGPQVRAIVCAVDAPRGVTEYSVLLSNLPAGEFDAVALWQAYGERQTIEAFFKLAREVYGIGNMRSRQFTAIQGFLWLIFIAHNLLQWVQAALFGGTVLGAIGTRELVAKVGRVGARRERTATGWRILLPPLDALARRFMQCLSPPAVQLTLPLRL